MGFQPTIIISVTSPLIIIDNSSIMPSIFRDVQDVMYPEISWSHHFILIRIQPSNMQDLNQL